MNRVETHFREEQYDKSLVKGYLAVQETHKRHYMSIYLYLYYFRSSPRRFPDVILSFLAAPQIESRKFHFASLPEILDSISSVSGDELIDGLTFTGLPCRFDFFFTEWGIDHFIDLLSRITDASIKNRLARMAFVSPAFLSFVSEVFCPILSPLISKPAPAADILASSITQRWRCYVNMIPAVVVKLLTTEKHPEQTLSAGFFETALTPENARLFGLVRFFQTIASPLLSVLKNLLTFSGDSSILTRLIELTRAAVPTPLLTETERNNVPSLFQSVLLSDFDTNAYTSLQTHSPFRFPLSYRLRSAMPDDEDEFSCDLNRLDQTMLVTDRPEVHLRHLLQAADPIPRFLSVPKGLTIIDFFNRYLVNRGPSESVLMRAKAVAVLQKLCRSFSESSIVSTLRNVSLERKKEICALSAFTSIANLYTGLDADGLNARTDVQRVLYSVLVGELLEGKFRAKPMAEYVNSPVDLARTFIQLSKLIEASGAYRHSPFTPVLVYGYLTREFSFEAFRGLRPALGELDAKLGESLGERAGQAIDALLNTTRKSKYDMLTAILGEIRKQDEIMEILRAAFTEENPIAKVGLAMRSFNGMRKCVAESVLSEDLGADEIWPLLACFIIIVNPPFCMSNWVYIHDFCDGEVGPAVDGKALDVVGMITMVARL
jgi:hypothetical protein